MVVRMEDASVESVVPVKMLDMVVVVCGGDAPELGPRLAISFQLFVNKLGSDT